jgi:uncharacterized membrane protein
MTHPLWNRHPGVRGTDQLTLGERAADRMKRVLATWTCLFGFLLLMAVWMATGGFGADRAPFIGLNLVLSGIAGLQCFVLLIAAKRADQISAETAAHDLATDEAAKELVEVLARDFAELKAQHAAQSQTLSDILAALATPGAEPAPAVPAQPTPVATRPRRTGGGS